MTISCPSAVHRIVPHPPRKPPVRPVGRDTAVRGGVSSGPPTDGSPLMAKKPRKPSLDLAVYLAVRLAVCLVQALPPALAFKIAEFLAWVAYTVDRRHREVAADNLRHAFPELAADPARLDRLVRATYRHFLRMVVEIALLPRKMHPTTWR